MCVGCGRVLRQLVVSQLLVLGRPLRLGDDAAIGKHRTRLPGLLGVGHGVRPGLVEDDARSRRNDFPAVATAGLQNLPQVLVAAAHRR